MMDQSLLESINNCVNFNILVDISCTFLNKKFNLNLESEFYRLLKT